MLHLSSDQIVLVPMKRTNFHFIIDAEDFDFVNQYEWEMKDGYAVTRLGEDKFPMPLHRLLLNLKQHDPIMGDHINRIRLDNRRENLRTANKSENMSNRSKFNRQGITSKYKGVRYLKKNKYWQARIQKENKPFLIGHFYSEVAAANMYNLFAKAIHGDFAVLNDVEHMPDYICENYRVRKGRLNESI